MTHESENLSKDSEKLWQINAKIDNIEDLETAGILALLGHLDSVEILKLQDINLSCAPSNIVNSLFKVVNFNGDLSLERVCGFSLSMLVNKKCENLTLLELKIPTQVAQVIQFRGEVILCNVDGDLRGLFDNICCDELTITDMILSSDEAKSLTEMLKTRVRKLDVTNLVHEKTLNYTALTKYDGQGSCEIICFHSKDNNNMYKEDLLSWADSVGWKVFKSPFEFDWENYKFVMKRTSKSQPGKMFGKLWGKVKKIGKK